MKLIIGLGNPGRGYANNRHNIGFICLNHFAKQQGIHLYKKQCRARTGDGVIDGIHVILARPQNYMNLSGQSVSRLVNKFKVAPDDILVIHDDLDLPLGILRIRKGGSSGGHKGIDSIINELGSRDFTRIKIGISRPVETAGEDDIVRYVLSDFTPDEKQAIKPVITKVSEAIAYILTEGLEMSMNRYN